MVAGGKAREHFVGVGGKKNIEEDMLTFAHSGFSSIHMSASNFAFVNCSIFV